jgi:hypothetical protein
MPAMRAGEDVVNSRLSRWITKAAAVAALVGALEGVASATVLSAGGFPGANVSTGLAKCVLTNTGTRDVAVRAVTLFDANGAVLVQQPGWIVSPGQTSLFANVSMITSSASSCTFDVSTKTGVRAAFVYHDGSAFTVIPAQK